MLLYIKQEVTMKLLDQKIACEHLWTKLYKENGSYTPDMMALTLKIRDLTKQIIVQDQNNMHKRFHNQAK
jgi:hypothetical protein|tara:strand:- start:221 stop:430 length:210 start_codon:yes stop_codon:yes gene_type:complete